MARLSNQQAITVSTYLFYVLKRKAIKILLYLLDYNYKYIFKKVNCFSVQRLLSYLIRQFQFRGNPGLDKHDLLFPPNKRQKQKNYLLLEYFFFWRKQSQGKLRKFAHKCQSPVNIYIFHTSIFTCKGCVIKVCKHCGK